MKRIKINHTVLLVFALVFFYTNTVFSQTIEELNVKLSMQYNEILKHTYAIVSGEAKTKMEQIMHANEAAKSLSFAKESRDQLKRLMSKETKAIAKPFHKNIDAQHTAASNYSYALDAELLRGDADFDKVIEHAKNLNDAITLAEKEHQSLIERTNQSLSEKTK